jgi:hypothetical protein
MIIKRYKIFESELNDHSDDIKDILYTIKDDELEYHFEANDGNLWYTHKRVMIINSGLKKLNIRIYSPHPLDSSYPNYDKEFTESESKSIYQVYKLLCRYLKFNQLFNTSTVGISNLDDDPEEINIDGLEESDVKPNSFIGANTASLYFSNRKLDYIELSKRIYNFLDKYASIRPDYDPEHDDESEKYTSPDASDLRYCADLLKNEDKPTFIWSEWSSGGYKPYNSKEGRIEHDSIISEIKKIIKTK